MHKTMNKVIKNTLQNTLKNTMKISLALTVILGFNHAAVAAEKTATLDIPSMNCAMCPITIKKSLEKVDGVTNVEISLDKKSTIITFNDEKTQVDVLIKATTEAGYPSSETP